MDLHQLCERVETREDFVEFMEAYWRSLKETPNDWQNDTLECFLSAFERYADGIDGWYRNRGVEFPENPTWEMFAHMFMGARIYD